MQKEAVLENLVLQYEGYFDVTRPFQHNNHAFLMYGHFTQRQEKYMLVRKATLYAFETNEHVFVAETDELNDASFAALSEFIIRAEEDFVTPTPEHMFSYMTLIILCDSMTEQAKDALKRLRYTKNYRYSVQGYSTVRIGAIELSTETVVTNRAGKKDLVAVLERAIRM